VASGDAPLRVHLEEAWKARHSGKPGFLDLYQFDIPDVSGRGEFAKAAAACEEVWRKPLPAAGARPGAGVDFGATAKLLQDRFAEFSEYLKGAIVTPLDFFKLLKWAREPSMSNARSYWGNVWEELYLLIVAFGRQKAVTTWNHLPTQVATKRLKEIGKTRPFDPDETLLPGSGDWGFHPDDAVMIYAPFIDRKREAMGGGPGMKLALLRSRILMHHQGVENFYLAQTARRAAYIYALLRNLNLLDEIEALIFSEEREFADPLSVTNRIWTSTTGTYRIGDGEKDFFTVIWIDGSRDRRGLAPAVYIEFHAFPGQIFKTGDPGALPAIAKDRLFKLVSESLTALGEFLLTYLSILGFAFDIITAGVATTTLRGLLIRYLEEKLVEAVVDKGLDAANIQHPAIRLAVQAGVGMRIGGSGRRLKGVAELEEEAANVLKRGRPRRPRRPKAAARAAVAAGQSPPPASGHFEVYDPATKPPVRPKDLEEMEKFCPLEFAEEEGALETIAAAGKERIRQAGLANARMTAPAGPHGTLLLRVPDAPAGPAVGGGLSPKSLAKAKRRAAKFEDSDAYKAVDLYKSVISDGDWIEITKRRQNIRQALLADPKLSMRQANAQLRAVLNRAKDKSGEAIAIMDVWSRFKVVETLAIPIRGENGAAVLDVAVRLEKGEPFKFVLVEAKGNVTTPVGRGVTRKLYLYNKNGKLEARDMPSGDLATQASPEWYYQKFAEIYISGQKIGGREGKRRMDLALELIEAARGGKIKYQVIKVGQDRAREIDDTLVLTGWFAREFKPRVKGQFPIPAHMRKK
jgi:hypothetical protein